MNSQVKILFAVLVAVSAITLAKANEDLIWKIFSEDVEPISSEETLELLKQLARDKFDKFDKFDRSLINSMIEANNITRSKCDDDGILKYTFILKDKTSGNGFRYMHDKREKLFELCHPYFSAKLQDGAKAYDADELKSVTELVSLIDSNRGDEQRIGTRSFGYFSPRVVGQSVLDFIQSKDGKLNLHPNDDEEREQLKGILKGKFNKLVQSPCKRVAESLIDAAMNFDTISYDRELADKVKPADWTLYNVVSIANHLSIVDTFEKLLETTNLD